MWWKCNTSIKTHHLVDEIFFLGAVNKGFNEDVLWDPKPLVPTQSHFKTLRKNRG
jgi:hypothetical protein